MQGCSSEGIKKGTIRVFGFKGVGMSISNLQRFQLCSSNSSIQGSLYRSHEWFVGCEVLAGIQRISGQLPQQKLSSPWVLRLLIFGGGSGCGIRGFRVENRKMEDVKL